MKTLKPFIIVSVLIHLIGALALYFYYNPIRLSKDSFYEEEPPALSSELEESDEALKDIKQIESRPSLKTESGPALVEKELALKENFLPPEDPLIEESIDGPIEESVEELLERESPEPLQTALELPSEEKGLEEAPKDRDREEILELEEMDIEPIQEQKSEPVEIEFKSIEEFSEDTPQKTSRQNNKSRIKNLSELQQKPGNPALEYPDFARREGMQGEVSVIFYVNTEGLIEQIQLESSSGHPELDNFVIRRLSAYEFLDRELWARFKKNFILKGEELEMLRLRTLDESSL